MAEHEHRVRKAKRIEVPLEDCCFPYCDHAASMRVILKSIDDEGEWCFQVCEWHNSEGINQDIIERIE